MKPTAGRIVFGLVAVGILALGIHLLPAQISGVRDVNTWYRAGEAIQEPGAPLYESTPGVAPYFGSPVFAALWAPLTMLGRPLAFGIWLFVVWGSVLVAFLLLRRLTGHGWWMLAFLPFIPMLMANGQVDAMVVAMILIFALALAADRNIEAGGVVALAAHLKVYPVVLIPILWAMGRRETSAWALGIWAGAGILLPAAWTGIAELPDLYAEHARVLVGLEPDGRSLTTILPGPLVRVSGVVMYALVLLDARRTDGPLRPLALGVSAVMLTSPILWEHSFLIMALPLADLMHRHPRWGTAGAASLGVAGLLFYFPEDSRIAWTLVSLAVWWGVFISPLPPSRTQSERGRGPVGPRRAQVELP